MGEKESLPSFHAGYKNSTVYLWQHLIRGCGKEGWSLHDHSEVDSWLKSFPLSFLSRLPLRGDVWWSRSYLWSLNT